MAIRSAIRNRLSDDSGPRLELPEDAAIARVDGLEPPVHRSVKGDVAGGNNGPTPHGQVFLDGPHFLARNRVPCLKHAAVSTRTGEHLHVHADVWRAGDVVR